MAHVNCDNVRGLECCCYWCGIDAAAGADAAVGALVGLISTKNDSGEQVDLSQVADISDLQDNFATELTNTDGVVAGQAQVNNQRLQLKFSRNKQRR